MKDETKEKNEAPGQNKEVTINVNGSPEVWREKKISFRQVVELAFPSTPENQNTIYTVTYSRGHDDDPKGSLVEGRSVRVKEGMIFNVTATGKS